MAEPHEPMVRLTGVTRRFGAVTAVDGVDLAVRRGDFLTIVGPSGCGKTTLLRMIAGFDRPDAGEIAIHGERVEAVPPYQRSIGMVFQRLALFPHMTAAQNVAYPLKMRRFDVREIPDRVARYLNLVQLGGYGGRRPHELSGGQQQRVAIARALSFSPDLLLLDEPLSALDRKLREEMQLEFRRIQQELGVTTINVTHDQREALVMSDQIVVMNDGAVQQSATPMDIYRAPENRFVASFIGMTSLFQGEVASIDGQGVAVRVGAASLRAVGSAATLEAGMRTDCAIRAEQIHVLEGDGAGFDNIVPGIVRQRIFEGDRILYAIEAEGLGVTLKVFEHDPISHREHAIGGRVTMGWNSRDLHAFPAA